MTPIFGDVLYDMESTLEYSESDIDSQSLDISSLTWLVTWESNVGVQVIVLHLEVDLADWKGRVL